ncbi:MAG: DUF3656 domain-containing protein [Oscillospiraceae bacterium]|nr:DUF3656 domain-containing protein [Oscillospiraceae bacterium]
MSGRRLEILAPAGNEEMLRAAVFAGADAVYLGFSGFNARASAGNFTAETLREAVSFCHGRGVRVHVALNTTVYPHEMKALAAAITAIAQTGADALIVQDLAVAALAREIAPELCLHGSTQMSVHSLEGACQLGRMGFSRVILARELSREEIAYIAANCPIETEIFVHGALCMSVSGQCYMSAFLGGRSGNRGSCAGTCRLPFCAGGKPGEEAHHLSLKDNSLLDKLADISSLGVVSAKIEGRLRTPEYVAAAVSAARAGRDGWEFDGELLKDAFSRSGFTQGYYQGKIDRAMFGMRTAADSAASKAAQPRLRELFRREYPGVGVSMKLTVEEEGAKLTVWDEAGNKAAVYGEDQPQPAKNDPVESMKKSLAKTGGTPFTPQSVEVEMVGGPWYLPGSAVNELRRQGLEKLLEKRSTLRPVESRQPQLAPPPRRAVPERQQLLGRFENMEQVPKGAFTELDALVLPIGQAEAVPQQFRAKTLLELPRVMFGALEKDTKKRIEATKNSGFAGYVAHNIAHVGMCRGLPVYGGFGLNVTNYISAREYAALGLKGITLLPEMTAGDMAYILPGVPTAALAYGRMPLMVTRACPLQNVTDCARCSKQGLLTDRKDKNFPVRCGLGVRTVYNPVPLYMGDKPGSLPTDAVVLYFTVESREEAAGVMESFAAQKPFEGEFTRGLYFKGTQSGNDAVNKALR